MTAGRATRESIFAALCDAGATTAQAERITAALEAAGLSPAQMRAWLAGPSRYYAVAIETVRIGAVTADWKLAPLWAIRDGHVDAAIRAAEAFAAATPDERLLARTFLCDLAEVRRITHDDPARTAAALRISRLLVNALRKDVAVRECIHVQLSGEVMGDVTRLVDWMRDERLVAALQALESGDLDPVELRRRGPIIP